MNSCNPEKIVGQGTKKNYRSMKIMNLSLKLTIIMKSTKRSQQKDVVVVVEILNNIFQSAVNVEDAKIFNQSWETFFERTSIDPAELWDPALVSTYTFC